MNIFMATLLVPVSASYVQHTPRKVSILRFAGVLLLVVVTALIGAVLDVFSPQPAAIYDFD